MSATSTAGDVWDPWAGRSLRRSCTSDSTIGHSAVADVGQTLELRSDACIQSQAPTFDLMLELADLMREGLNRR
jgi:hypothetical protein